MQGLFILIAHLGPNVHRYPRPDQGLIDLPTENMFLFVVLLLFMFIYCCDGWGYMPFIMEVIFETFTNLNWT
jgi:hypothetical protein